MKNKKSQGQIIVTVLIILLVIVGISVIGFFVTKVVREKAEEAKILSSINLDIQIEQALYNEDEGVIYVTVGRNPGEGNLTGLKFIVTFDDGSSEIFTIENPDSLPDENEKRVFELVISDATKQIDYVEVAPIIDIGGEDRQLDVSSKKEIVITEQIIENALKITSSDRGGRCNPDCSCAEDICQGNTCKDPVCGEDCEGELESDCTGKECGVDPVCGEDCGTCSSETPYCEEDICICLEDIDCIGERECINGVCFGAPILDQSLTGYASTYGFGGIWMWQSFTAGIDGNLKIVKTLTQGGSGSSSSIQFKVYNGEGMSGNLLYSQIGDDGREDISQGNKWSIFNLDEEVLLVSGQKYTIAVNDNWMIWRGYGTERYAGGKAGGYPNVKDYSFQTYMMSELPT